MKILGIHSRSLRKYVGAMHVAISVNVATKTHRLECFACGVVSGGITLFNRLVSMKEETWFLPKFDRRRLSW
jgi:hypothetical protein